MKNSSGIFRVVLLVLAFFSALPLSANTELTESDVVELGLENPQVKAQMNAQLEKARGELQRAGRWENPAIEYSREDVGMPGGTSEETSFWLSQKINIAGVKGLQREAAAKSFKAQEIELALDAQRWKKILREEFYKTFAAQQKSTVLDHTTARLKTINEMVLQRAEKGDASRFDALRIQKELSVMQSRGASAQARFSGLRNSLFANVNAPYQTLAGNLLPSASIAETFEWSQHPQLQAMQIQQQSAELSARAAGREAWPELRLGVGRTELNEPEFVADGNTISVGITIPLFDRGRGGKHVAENEARQLRAESILLQRQLQAAYQSAVHAYHTNKNAAEELDVLSTDPHSSLSRLAEASYQAGELSVMELLDAYQSDLDTTEQYIDSALEARMAYIQLQFLRGE